jgi:hypothetical protein
VVRRPEPERAVARSAEGLTVRAGLRAVKFGAGFVPALASGLILGLLPLGLEIIGFGIVLGRRIDHGVLSGVFGMLFIAFGTLVGIGFTRSGMMENV